MFSSPVAQAAAGKELVLDNTRHGSTKTVVAGSLGEPLLTQLKHKEKTGLLLGLNKLHDFRLKGRDLI